MDRNRIQYHICCKIGAKIAEVQTEMDERQFGESYLNMMNSIKYMVKMMLSIIVVQNVRKRR